MAKSTSKLSRQYGRWVYPEPIHDLKKFFDSGARIFSDPSLFFYRLWPEREKFNPDILVAGCGTNLAAQIAYRNRDSKVVGADLSATSIQHSIKLKQKYKLENLTLVKGDFLEIDFEQDFDLIVATGVLHHLEDPVAGGAALKKLLRDGGVLYAMLYGMSHRVGVYMLQRAFREIGLKQSKKDVDIARECIKFLPPSHSARRYIASTSELGYDGAFVDTFLHVQDVAFWADEIFEFIEDIGMTFQSWVEPSRYHPRTMMPSNHPLYKRALELDPESQAVFIDRMYQHLGTHRFLARKQEEARDDWTIDFNDPGFWSWVPHRHPWSKIKASGGRDGSPLLERSGMRQTLSHDRAKLLGRIDGKMTMLEVLLRLGWEKGPQNAENDQFRQAIRETYEEGHIMIQKAPRPGRL